MAAKSCSSFIIAGSETKTGDIIFAKNSDRPFNESQPLIYYPAQDYPEGTFTECSFIKIPQVRHTSAQSLIFSGDSSTVLMSSVL